MILASLACFEYFYNVVIFVCRPVLSQWCWGVRTYLAYHCHLYCQMQLHTSEGVSYIQSSHFGLSCTSGPQDAVSHRCDLWRYRRPLMAVNLNRRVMSGDVFGCSMAPRPTKSPLWKCISIYLTKSNFRPAFLVREIRLLSLQSWKVIFFFHVQIQAWCDCSLKTCCPPVWATNDFLCIILCLQAGATRMKLFWGQLKQD